MCYDESKELYALNLNFFLKSISYFVLVCILYFITIFQNKNLGLSNELIKVELPP